jgi:ATP-dependent Clp protease protease subunit
MSKLLYLTEQEDDNVDYVIKSILSFNEEDKDKLDPTPIKLYINCYGGDVYQFLGLIDVIESSITPIHTITLGAAMSCAFLVTLSGHKRFAYKNSTFMYHQISTGEWGTAKNLEEDLIETKRLQKIIENRILSKTKITKKQLSDNYNSKNDWYLGAEEALKYHIIDQIL